MRFNLNIFDAPAKPQDQILDVESSAVDKTEPASQDPTKIIQVCKICKKQTPISVENWAEWWGEPPETDKEKIARLLEFCELYNTKDKRLRFMPMHKVIHGMLSVDGVDGEQMFNGMEESSKAYFAKVAKNAFDVIVGEYLAIGDMLMQLDKYGQVKSVKSDD